jgi:hypothetical protein
MEGKRRKTKEWATEEDRDEGEYINALEVFAGIYLAVIILKKGGGGPEKQIRPWNEAQPSSSRWGGGGGGGGCTNWKLQWNDQQESALYTAHTHYTVNDCMEEVFSAEHNDIWQKGSRIRFGGHLCCG